jgi:hypothetical protein
MIKTGIRFRVPGSRSRGRLRRNIWEEDLTAEIAKDAEGTLRGKYRGRYRYRMFRYQVPGTRYQEM